MHVLLAVEGAGLTSWLLRVLVQRGALLAVPAADGASKHACVSGDCLNCEVWGGEAGSSNTVGGVYTPPTATPTGRSVVPHPSDIAAT